MVLRMYMDTLRNGVQLGIVFSGSEEVPRMAAFLRRLLDDADVGSRLKSVNIMQELVY